MALNDGSINHRHIDTDSDDSKQDRTWPRFLVMEGTDIDKPLKKLSPFAIAMGIQGIAGEPKSVKNISNGLLIEVSKKAHADYLLNATTIALVPIRVKADRSPGKDSLGVES